KKSAPNSERQRPNAGTTKMPIKPYKPTSPGRRFGSVGSFADITKTEPERRLTGPVKRSGGRNNSGKLTMRHVGGGAKRLYRTIDFKPDNIGVPGKVVAIEYDPNRSARIALVQYADGDKRYILAPQGVIVGTPVLSADDADIKAGNSLKMRNIP